MFRGWLLCCALGFTTYWYTTLDTLGLIIGLTIGFRVYCILEFLFRSILLITFL